MTKFLTLWEMDTTRIPESPEEQIRDYTMMVNMIKDDLKTGKTLEFGMFAGGLEDTSFVKELNRRFMRRR